MLRLSWFPDLAIRSYILFLLILVLLSCTVTSSPEVVVYTSVDQVFSEPILKEFAKETGIKVLPVYDVESAKTTGLVYRIMAESSHPRADVFWNGEFAQTLLLKKKGLLDVYHSPEATDISSIYRDRDGYWTSFSARARVIIVNTDLVSTPDFPTSIFDLINGRFNSMGVAVAYPLFGTSATHAAAIYTTLGRPKAREFFRHLASSGAYIVSGNSVVRDMVASGKAAVGLTDTDDACAAILKEAHIKVIFPDQGREQMGTLIIPGTVSLIARCPHPENAKKLIDYLLSKKVEERLFQMGWSYERVHRGKSRNRCFGARQIKKMQLTPEQVCEHLEEAMSELKEIFVR